ncbi:conserved hypothetical protein [Helicobacter cinaedi PAGU611]|uniref:ParA family protein n=1 Tax=Helicobacter cinaedi TaxID=213 RepID=UPI00025D35C9|nr:ParA family protein [Helicobacter cinaedi]BAM13101.1 conserved hypothetical protein [Helicobacter cinaedi PAGU611]BBB21013.1 plasmid partitioning protein ParA [Helicobacter cinaedi]
MIITIANQKGGSGKSTIAINAATKLLEQSQKVLLLDTDSQKNCEGFTNIRESQERILIATLKCMSLLTR